MKTLLTLLTFLCLSSTMYGQQKTIHVFVALCDNENQGIVPVPATLGNGKDIKNNLYWGAAFGVKSYFKHKTSDWNLVRSLPAKNPYILERLLFKHAIKDVYMLADAYDGERIKHCTTDFLKAANGQLPLIIALNSKKLGFGGRADLMAYIGHDGLMDFEVDLSYHPKVDQTKDVIILACYSKNYFSPHIKSAKANPILWTTHLMAPEAYSLKAALDGWMENEDGTQIKERAAQAYDTYQKCGIRGARNLFAYGF